MNEENSPEFSFIFSDEGWPEFFHLIKKFASTFTLSTDVFLWVAYNAMLFGWVGTVMRRKMEWKFFQLSSRHYKSLF